MRIDTPEEQSLQYADLIKPWYKYLAFLLSFINISSFWTTHHRLFADARRMDERAKRVNIIWLFFIVILPFSTNILSDHFSSKPGQILLAQAR